MYSITFNYLSRVKTARSFFSLFISCNCDLLFHGKRMVKKNVNWTLCENV